MWRNLRSLRFRLILAFVLVSVPPMLAATYIGAQLISDAFETNVEQWLEETSQFFISGIKDTNDEVERATNVIATRIKQANLQEPQIIEAINKDIPLLKSVGYDLIALYDENRKIILTTAAFESAKPLPLQSTYGIFQFSINKKDSLISGSVLPVSSGNKPLFLIIGTQLDQGYLSSTKVVTSLELRLYHQTKTNFEPIAIKGTTDTSTTAVPQTAIDRLNAGEEAVFDQTATENTYRSVYSAIRDVDNKLAGILFIGIESSESFSEQINQLQLFSGIFIFGSVLSIFAGLWMSGLLVRPLKALTIGVRSITSGNYQSRVKEKGSSEIQELASGFNGMAAQLSKLHNLEDELRKRDRMTALGEAAMVIAHEVRNPLGIIKTSAEVVRKRAHLGASEERLLGYVVDEVRRIERLIKDFLDFARPKTPIKHPVKLRVLVDRVAALARVEAQKHHVDLQVIEVKEHVEILGDIDQLHQALLNLMLNALDAMPDSGTLKITIDSNQTDASISVSDTGAGIAPDIIDKVFDPFFTTKAKGTGLGLAKVQHVAEAHGGKASCTSIQEQGAMFTISLPKLAPSAIYKNEAL
jgi:two-component system, NtrC family, sensor histidine kinase HydH